MIVQRERKINVRSYIIVNGVYNSRLITDLYGENMYAQVAQIRCNDDFLVR